MWYFKKTYFVKRLNKKIEYMEHTVLSLTDKNCVQQTDVSQRKQILQQELSLNELLKK